MTDQELQKFKYPIGEFDCPNNISEQHIDSWLSILEHFPNRLERLVEGLTRLALPSLVLALVYRGFVSEPFLSPSVASTP